MSALLVKNGTVIDTEPEPHVLPGTDVLVDDGRIVRVGVDLPADEGTEVVDASRRLVLPGFVDTHRHTWLSALRGIVLEGTLEQYLERVLVGYGSRYRPEDVHAGNLVGAVECLDAGITTLFDWSHSAATPEHADAAVDALHEAGIRAVYGYGLPVADDEARRPFPPDVRRLRESRLPNRDALVTMALAVRGPALSAPAAWEADIRLARELGCRISMHVFEDAHIAALAERDLLGDDITYVHCMRFSADTAKRVADTGGSASVASAVEANLAMGYPPVATMRDAGVVVSLSADVVACGPGDMFGVMRAAAQLERAQGLPAAPEDVLRMATLDGATALGMADTVGSLRPGKQADLVLLRTDTPAMSGLVDPIGAVVNNATTQTVDSVYVAGRAVKRDGRLLGTVADRAVDLAASSVTHLLAA